MQIVRGRSGPLSFGSPLAFIDRLSLTEVFLNWTAVPLSRAIGLIIPPLSLAFGLHPFHASLYDLATRFLPYFLWSGLVMSWLSGGKVIPILFDVSQIIVMPQILKAALFGLARPQGQKFQVTAKGGDRNQGFVEWAVMRPFVILIVLSLAAVLWAFYVNGGSNEIHYSSSRAGLDLVQSYCPRRALLCLRRAASPPSGRAVCVARAGFRQDGRPHATDATRRRLHHRRAHLRRSSRRSRGVWSRFELPNFRISATIVRREGDTFAVAFNHTLKSRVAAIQHFYSGGYFQTARLKFEFCAWRSSVLRRVFD